jgi:hypothetical protein
LELLQTTDDRRVLYRVIEYLFHLQVYNARLKEIEDEETAVDYKAKKDAVLEKPDDDLGIDLFSIFRLTV